MFDQNQMEWIYNLSELKFENYIMSLIIFINIY